jgi:predicted transcriptional regulator
MERKTATPLDISLVVAAADVVGRYASQNPMSKMELAIMIADVHSLLVERVDSGPRVRIATDGDGEAKTTLIPGLLQQADEIKTETPATDSPPAKPEAAFTGAGKNAFRDDYVVAEPNEEPFLPIKSSVWTDKIVCLECGKSFATLKRHLTAVHKQTDVEYRKKFGLSAKYPMICETFESSRRKLMRDHGAFKPLTREDKIKRSTK